MEIQIVSRNLCPCLVCGDAAVGINFTVPTCAPCKAFFRRNAVKLGRVDFVCQADGDCPVTYESRRICNCCRLAKCFRVGMQKSLIRTEVEREERRQLIEINREKRRQLVMLQNLGFHLPSKRIRLAYKQSDYLTTNDQMLLTNIMAAYDRACSKKNVQNLCFPSREHSCPHTFFNEYQDREISLIEYFKLIPEFNRLSIQDKIRLVRNHFGTMYYINEPVLAPYKSNNLVASIRKSFHGNLALRMIHSIDLMFSYVHDPVLLKLVLIVRSLSSSINRYRNDTDMDRIYDDTKLIFAGQNVYVELLWKYVLYRSASERDAVKFFNKLVMDILSIQHTYLMSDYYLYCLQDEIDKLEPLMKSMWPIPDENESMHDADVDMLFWS